MKNVEKKLDEPKMKNAEKKTRWTKTLLCFDEEHLELSWSWTRAFDLIEFAI